MIIKYAIFNSTVLRILKLLKFIPAMNNEITVLVDQQSCQEELFDLFNI